MNVQKWLDNPKTVKKSIKKYSHFDYRIDARKAANYISNPNNIAKHGFYPFIHYTMKMKKYNKKTGVKIKEREICYASHMDRCIFQYYAYWLNELYNMRLQKDGIENVPVAYRTDLKDSNIQSSRKAFDFIKSNSNCYVMIGDFTGFFDNLDHQYLKKQWCELLNVTKLPADHYAVFKNITKYSIWELEDLLKLNGLSESDSDIRRLNKKKVVLSKEQYNKNRKNIVKHTESYGIPQGSPISAVLANIYMLEADKAIYEIVKLSKGFYMRYSDDFMIVLPEQEDYKVFKKIIDIIKSVKNLQLENKKTQFFEVKLQTVTNVSKAFAEDADDSQKLINFLGFSYDGKHIYLRSKTVGKFYYRRSRKIKAIAKNEKFEGADNLYMKYSERGAYGRGNFFTYVKHAEEEFGTDDMIRRGLKNNMGDIRKGLNKYKNG